MKNISTLNRLPLLLCLLLFASVICVAQKPELVIQTGHTASVYSVVFSPDGRTLASGSGDHTIKLWDVATGVKLRTLESPDNYVQTVTFSPDGRTLASGSSDTINLWDVATGVRLRALGDSAETVAFSPDGRTLASSDYRCRSPKSCQVTIKLWDVATGKSLRTLENISDHLSIIAFSPDGKTLAIGYADTINLLDLGTGKKLRALTERAGGVMSLTFSPDGKVLASDGWDRTIKLWDVAMGAPLRALSGLTEFVNTVAFSPDGRTLACGSMGAKIMLLDKTSGQELASLIALDKTDWIVATPDGLFDGSPAAWSKLIWRAPQNTFDFVPVEAYFSDFYYPGLLADIFAGKQPQAPTKIEDKDRRQPQVKLLAAELLDWSDSRVKDQDRSHFYMRVTVEVAEAPADKDHKQGSGAQDVRLFRDGTLVKIWHGDVLGGRSSVKLETDVPVLPGENHFTAYAFNRDNIKSGDGTLTAKGDQKGEQAPLVRTAYVLAVGVNRYANAQFNLKFAVPDAQDFGETWARQQEQLRQFQRVEIVSLLDEEATKANIMLAIKRLVDLKPEPLPDGAPKQLERFKYAEPQDAVVIYFAGHGTAQGQRFYLIPHDLGYTGKRDEVTAEGLQTLLAHSISDLELESAFEGLQGGQQVFVIDACNSGQALEAEEKRRGPMNSKGLAQLAYEKGMYILTASQNFQFANEAPRLGHGYLTYALVEEGLKKGAARADAPDGLVSLREWFNYATERVPTIHQEEKARMAEDRLARLRALGIGMVDEAQRPRVFYRREVERQPLIVTKSTTQTAPPRTRP